MISSNGLVTYDDWHPLAYVGSSSFVRCVDLDEQALWQPAIDAGRAMETTSHELRVWFDPLELRLLVLAYQP